MSSDPSKLPGDKHFNFSDVLQKVTSPLSLLALVVLTVFGVWMGKNPSGQVAFGLIAVLLFVTAVVLYAISNPKVVAGLLSHISTAPRPSGIDDAKVVKERIDEVGDSVIFFPAYERKCLDYWYRELRPVLHQATMYSTPTYYLDTKLGVIDWNIAFELIFDVMTDKIRGKHVNWFIARLANQSQVFDHARKFTEDYQRTGVFPFVDIEPLEYDSKRYGKVRFTKVAAQLHSLDGQFKGWSISLFLDAMGDRALFTEDLQERLGAEKMWSVYSASYDRVLNRFPPYQTLIRDVIGAVRGKDQYVLDLGAGTGNVTAELLASGHRVVAVENNSGMLDRFAQRMFESTRVSVVKTSVEQLSCLDRKMFDAAVMVNVLYAVNDPLACLRGIHRILKPGGVLSLSTTHRETDLTPLLNSIEAELQSQPNFDEVQDDWNNVRKINRMLERSIVRRHTREDYLQWLQLAGFEVTDVIPSTYCDAVMLVHARRLKESQYEETEKQKPTVAALA
jgi:ubiquinone/menaquinone biosynthesis C-methylase UbiE